MRIWIMRRFFSIVLLVISMIYLVKCDNKMKIKMSVLTLYIVCVIIFVEQLLSQMLGG